LFFPGITEESIGSVLIKDVRDWVRIERKGSSWVVIPKPVLLAEAQGGKVLRPSCLFPLDFPVDSYASSAMTRSILRLKRMNLVSENPLNQASYEVDTVLGTRVEVFDTSGKSLGVVYVGISGPGEDGAFVRGDGSNNVYLLFDISRYDFASPHDRWPDKQMTNYRRADMRTIRLSPKGKEDLVLEKGEANHPGGWYITKPVKKPADSEKVHTLIVYVSSLMAWAYEDSALADTATGFSDPSVTVTVGFVDGTSRQIIFGKRKPGPEQRGGVTDIWARVPEKPWIYLTKSYDRDQFIRKPADFELMNAVLKGDPIAKNRHPLPGGKQDFNR